MPLNAVRMFEAVAKHSSFTRAADALHVTTAAISMQIKSLEDYLDVKLFRRGRRSVQLTLEGETLLPFVQRGLDELEQGFSLIKAGREGGTLVVSTVTSFLQKWLLPRMAGFQQLHPEIDVQMRASSQLVDFSSEDVHVAIRIGRGGWAPLHAEKLLDEWLVAICSPQVFARHGSLQAIGDTGGYALIHSSSEPWALWTSRGVTADVADQWPRTGMAFDDSVSVVVAAERHQGLALARWSVAADAIAAGRVVMAYPTGLSFARSYYFVCPPAYLGLPKVAKFRTWLMATAADWHAP